MQLDDWVLCRIYNKKGAIEKQPPQGSVGKSSAVTEIEDKKPDIATLMDTRQLPPPPTGLVNDYVYFDTSESVPRLHTDSSCSEHVVSPEFTCEVQSEPQWKDWGSTRNNTTNALDFPYNYMDATVDNGFPAHFQSNNQLSPLQDMFMYLPKPF